jgi:hypothetical protein
MVLGMTLPTFTQFHVALSLVGILAGFVVLLGMLRSKRMPRLTILFLATTILTSVTGFFFPFTGLLPSHVVGIISLATLALAVVALYGSNLMGSWRWIYVASALFALYLNVFVAVVQAFLKFPALERLAPTQSEPPFLIAQGAVLLIFVAFFVAAVRAFRPQRRR